MCPRGLNVMSNATDGKFELLKNLSERFEPRQPWLSIGGDRVAQQANQRPAIVLGQVEGAFRREQITTGHRGTFRRDFDTGKYDSTWSPKFQQNKSKYRLYSIGYIAASRFSSIGDYTHLIICA